MWTVYCNCLPQAIGGSLLFLQETASSPLNLLHEFIFGNYPIRMEHNLREKSCEIKVDDFPIFSRNYVTEYNLP